MDLCSRVDPDVGRRPKRKGGSGVGVRIFGTKGIILLCGLAVALGFMLFSLAISTRADSNKPAALVVALVSLVILVAYAIGISDNGQLSNMITIARYLYIVWVVWAIMLGLKLVMDNSPSSG